MTLTNGTILVSGSKQTVIFDDSVFSLKGLTVKQKELMDYLVKRISVDGISPSYSEMCEVLKVSSKSGISRMVVALEARGCLVRSKNCARSLFPTANYVTATYSFELIALISAHGIDKSIEILRGADETQKYI